MFSLYDKLEPAHSQSLELSWNGFGPVIGAGSDFFGQVFSYPLKNLMPTFFGAGHRIDTPFPTNVV